MNVNRMHAVVVIAMGITAAGGPPTVASDRAAHTIATMGSFDNNGEIHILRHPKRFKVVSADSYVVFSGLRWSGWGTSKATATGKVRTCADDGCERDTVKLTADRLRNCEDDYEYHRMIASTVPLYGSRALKLPLEPLGCVHEGDD